MKFSPEQIKESRAYREIYNSNIPDEELTEILENLCSQGNDRNVLFFGGLEDTLIDFFCWDDSNQGDEYWRKICERM